MQKEGRGKWFDGRWLVGQELQVNVSQGVLWGYLRAYRLLGLYYYDVWKLEIFNQGWPERFIVAEIRDSIAGIYMQLYVYICMLVEEPTPPPPPLPQQQQQSSPQRPTP